MTAISSRIPTNPTTLEAVRTALRSIKSELNALGLAISEPGTVLLDGGAGSSSTPTLSFVGDTDTGFYHVTAGSIGLTIDGTLQTRIQISTWINNSQIVLAWSSSSTAPASGTIDIGLARVSAGVLAQRAGTTSQEKQIYSTFTSASSYQRSAIKSAKTTLSGVTGATVTATNLIPDGAFLLGVTTRVNTGLGITGGTTGYAVGDAGDPNKWGDVVGTAAGTASGSTGFTAAAAAALYTATDSVILTAAGGNFDGTGVIEVCAHYLITEAD